MAAPLEISTGPKPSGITLLTPIKVSSPAPGDADTAKVVYVGFAADIVHHGHINIIQVAAKLGRVIVGLLTDEAIRTYKRQTIISWEDRKKVVDAFVGVAEVVPQYTLDYSDNLKKYRPHYVVHGSDWRNGTQQATRQKVIDLLATWGGELIEPEYTRDISTTDIIKACYDYERSRKAGTTLDKSRLADEVDCKVDFATKDIAQELEAQRPICYVAVSTDFLHHGHIHILKEAAQLGKVVVGLLVDEAVQKIKHKPVVAFEHRMILFQNIKYVSWVIPQFTLDYTPNLRALKPNFVVHGDDWKAGPQQSIREQVVHVLSEWGGKLIEPKYTETFTEAANRIEETCYDRVAQKQPGAPSPAMTPATAPA